MDAAAAALRLSALALGAAAVVAGSALLGPTWISPAEIFADSPSVAFWQLRAPRVLLAAAAGAGLSVGGVIFQILFRNPLATPYTLGIDTGASVAAATGVLLNLGGYIAGVPTLSLLAFGGALSAMGLVFLLSRGRAGDTTRLLLSGVSIAYLCAAGITLITFLGGRPITNEILTWTMGSLSVPRPRGATEIAVVLIPVLAYALHAHRSLDLMLLGDDLAASRGVNVARTVWTCYGLVGLLTAVIVANCGPIGFVGLMVPHMARALLGPHTLHLLVGSTILGAAFLAVCDALARSFSVAELPVGVVTNILGAAFFLSLLAARERAHAGAR